MWYAIALGAVFPLINLAVPDEIKGSANVVEVAIQDERAPREIEIT